MNKMATLGHNNAVALDGTFGTNEYGLHTLLCFDEWQNGIPTTWALTKTRCERDLTVVMEAIKGAVERTRSEVLKLDETWLPSSFLVDCATEEHNALIALWPTVPIVLCLWHVRRAQYKNILKKIQDPSKCAEVNADLGEIMQALATDALEMSEDFMTKWKDKAKEFVAYYRKEWHHRVHRWGRVRNKNIENYVWAAILRAREIPDTDVTFFPDSDTAMVRSQTPPMVEWHVLERYNYENCICTCDSSVQGNTCKHQVKILLMKGMKEIDVLHKFGTRVGSICAPTNEFELPLFGEKYEDVEMPEIFNVSLPMDLDDGFDDKSFVQSKTIAQYTDDQFKAVVEEICLESHGNDKVCQIAMTKLLNWRHDLKNLVAKAGRTKVDSQVQATQKFKTMDPENTQKRHLSFVDTIYRGQKRQLAKRKTAAEKTELDNKALDDATKPFKKQIAVKEATQQFLDRAAKEHAEGKKAGRRRKQTINVNQNGTLKEVEPKKTTAPTQKCSAKSKVVDDTTGETCGTYQSDQTHDTVNEEVGAGKEESKSLGERGFAPDIGVQQSKQIVVEDNTSPNFAISGSLH
ncbi:unnamed protein product [Calypogeia fissa]